MNIKEFTDRMKTALSDALNREVHIVNPLKTNGIRPYGLAVKGPDSNTSPTIYLEPFFERYLDTDDWVQAVKDVLAFYENNVLTDSVDMDRLMDFGRIQKKLYYRLINYEANRELLAKIPHTRFLDLAKVYYADCEIGGNMPGRFLIHYGHIRLWGIDENELVKTAEENTPGLYPAYIRDMLSALMPGNPLDTLEAPEDFSSSMFALTNAEADYGAAAVCYKGVLDDFARKIEDDLVILPSSVHETILLPLHKNGDIDHLKCMVYDINRTLLEPSEFLSDNVYLFNRQNKQLTIA